jgi:tRNA A37 threonylcarbamoyladenosine biosynthesis protein TsaE
LIHHFDFYRLATPGLIAHELAEVADDPRAVSVIEWGDVVREGLPKKRITITITAIDEDSRKLEVQLPKGNAYILEGINQ